jgi:uncharacterized membrane protein
MSEQAVEPSVGVGPIDYVLIEFPGSQFNGQIAPNIVDLVNNETIRLLDLVFVHKTEDGDVESLELSDAAPAEAGDLADVEVGYAGLMSEDDLDAAAAVLEPGSSALLLVWENTWAAPLATAIRESGGQLVSSGRIPVNAILSALDASAGQ